MTLRPSQLDELSATADTNGRSNSTPIPPNPTNMSADQTQTRVKGKNVTVPSAHICGRTVIASGRWLKTDIVKDEDMLEGDGVADPEAFIPLLKASGLKADIFTFAQKLPDTAPKYAYAMAWDNFAVIPVSSYSDWWKNRIESSVQRAVRKAAKLGVVVKLAEFDDAFVRGICDINNEAPVRQGKPFWHFQKDFEAVKDENSTYADRNAFLGAYIEDELIGYIRITYVGKVASIIQVLSKMKHFEKRSSNALIAKAVEICEQQGFPYLMYCNYIYNDPKSSLTEFKRRNGFEQVLVPRYYIPLTLKGKIALRLGLHRGLVARIPKSVISQILKARRYWYDRKNSRNQSEQQSS
jgi:hypothetical protein